MDSEVWPIVNLVSVRDAPAATRFVAQERRPQWLVRTSHFGVTLSTPPCLVFTGESMPASFAIRRIILFRLISVGSSSRCSWAKRIHPFVFSDTGTVAVTLVFFEV